MGGSNLEDLLSFLGFISLINNSAKLHFWAGISQTIAWYKQLLDGTKLYIVEIWWDDKCTC